MREVGGSQLRSRGEVLKKQRKKGSGGHVTKEVLDSKTGKEKVLNSTPRRGGRKNNGVQKKEKKTIVVKNWEDITWKQSVPFLEKEGRKKKRPATDTPEKLE